MDPCDHQTILAKNGGRALSEIIAVTRGRTRLAQQHRHAGTLAWSAMSTRVKKWPRHAADADWLVAGVPIAPTASRARTRMVMPSSN